MAWFKKRKYFKHLLSSSLQREPAACAPKWDLRLPISDPFVDCNPFIKIIFEKVALKTIQREGLSLPERHSEWRGASPGGWTGRDGGRNDIKLSLCIKVFVVLCLFLHRMNTLDRNLGISNPTHFPASVQSQQPQRVSLPGRQWSPHHRMHRARCVPFTRPRLRQKVG